MTERIFRMIFKHWWLMQYGDFLGDQEGTEGQGLGAHRSLTQKSGCRNTKGHHRWKVVQEDYQSRTKFPRGQKTQGKHLREPWQQKSKLCDQRVQEADGEHEFSAELRHPGKHLRCGHLYKTNFYASSWSKVQIYLKEWEINIQIPAIICALLTDIKNCTNQLSKVLINEET